MNVLICLYYRKEDKFPFGIEEDVSYRFDILFYDKNTFEWCYSKKKAMGYGSQNLNLYLSISWWRFSIFRIDFTFKFLAYFLTFIIAFNTSFLSIFWTIFINSNYDKYFK